MHHPTPTMSPSWRSRARALLSRLFRLAWRDTGPLMVWAEMQPIGYALADARSTRPRRAQRSSATLR